MRVSVSLSDRDHDDWPRAKCADIDPQTCEPYDPREWDEAGTDFAASVCAQCDIADDCRTLALLERPIGQMRAGVWFDDDGEPRERVHGKAERCLTCHRRMTRRRRAPAGWVRHDGKGECQACAKRRQWKQKNAGQTTNSGRMLASRQGAQTPGGSGPTSNYPKGA
jgi:hypothetical protein